MRHVVQLLGFRDWWILLKSQRFQTANIITLVIVDKALGYNCRYTSPCGQGKSSQVHRLVSRVFSIL